MRKIRIISLLLALCLLCGLLTGCAKEAEKPGEETEAASEEALTQEAAPEAGPEKEPEPETPRLYEPEKGQWGSYADLYEACLIDTEHGMPLSKMNSPAAQMLDLDQNGVPEFAIYYGVTTDGELLDVFTIEDGTVKRLGDEVSWNIYRNEEARRDIPAIDEPISWEVVLTDSTYLYIDTRILPFDWDYGAFSTRLDAKTGAPFWMFIARQYDVAADDGVTYNDTGTYWRFETVDGKIKPVKLKSFGMQWDDGQPYLGYAVYPGEEPLEITFDSSFAVAVDGKSSKEITESFVAERDSAYPALDTAPEVSRRVSLSAGSDLEAILRAKRYFRSFHETPTEDDLQVTAKTALCKFFNSTGRSRGLYLNRFLEGEDPEQAILDYYADFADVLTQDCLDNWMAARTPFKYDKLMKETNCRAEVQDVSLEEYQRYEGAVTYSFTATMIVYDFNAHEYPEKTVTGQIQVGTEENLVRKLTIDPGQNWVTSDICALPQAVVE